MKLVLIYKKMNKAFARNKVHANQLAKEYFQREFKLKGNCGVGYMRKGDCGCNDSLFLQYYSKDDPMLESLFDVTWCRLCYEKEYNVNGIKELSLEENG